MANKKAFQLKKNSADMKSQHEGCSQPHNRLAKCCPWRSLLNATYCSRHIRLTSLASLIGVGFDSREEVCPTARIHRMAQVERPRAARRWEG
jgi:hypothetical protein